MSSEAGDPAKGKKVFMKACEHCHSIDKGGKIVFGPNLHGMFGRKAGDVSGYKYSEGHKKLDMVWNEKNLDAYLADPYKFVPGTKKHYHGLKNAKDRADVISYMEEQQ